MQRGGFSCCVVNRTRMCGLIFGWYLYGSGLAPPSLTMQCISKLNKGKGSGGLSQLVVLQRPHLCCASAWQRCSFLGHRMRCFLYYLCKGRSEKNELRSLCPKGPRRVRGMPALFWGRSLGPRSGDWGGWSRWFHQHRSPRDGKGKRGGLGAAISAQV